MITRLATVISFFITLNKVIAVESIDHSAYIKAMGSNEVKRGSQLYSVHCSSCHGKEGDLALNPLARRFGKDELKFGTDPYSLWKTISYGNGLMFRWDSVLTPKERYQIVHFIRETILKKTNPNQYFVPSDEYFDKFRFNSYFLTKDGQQQGP